MNRTTLRSGPRVSPFATPRSMARSTPRSMARAMRPRGFTLVELIVCLVIMCTVAALTIPFFASDHSDRAAHAAMLLQSDLRYAQLASMANTQDPVIVRFKADGKGYYLARVSTPNTALTRPDTGAVWDITMGQGRAGSSPNVTIATTNISGATLRFTPLGSVHNPTGTPMVTLTGGGPGGSAKACTITIDTVTGGTTTSFP